MHHPSNATIILSTVQGSTLPPQEGVYLASAVINYDPHWTGYLYGASSALCHSFILALTDILPYLSDLLLRDRPYRIDRCG